MRHTCNEEPYPHRMLTSTYNTCWDVLTNSSLLSCIDARSAFSFAPRIAYTNLTQSDQKAYYLYWLWDGWGEEKKWQGESHSGEENIRRFLHSITRYLRYVKYSMVVETTRGDQRVFFFLLCRARAHDVFQYNGDECSSVFLHRK